MNNQKLIEWVLRIAIAGEFFGHGMFALQGKEAWIDWIHTLTGLETGTASQLLTLVGYWDIAVAFIILLKPVRVILLWAAFWGFWTALVRPLVGEPVLDFIERWANWGAPLALLLFRGWPKSWKEWIQ